MSALGELWSYVTTAANWTGPRGLLALTWDHLRLSLFAVTVAALVSIPAGVVMGHVRRGSAVAVAVVNIGRALPAFAVLVLAFSVFASWGRGISIWPSFVALVLLAIPPMFTNTLTGVAEVPADVREAARGMGLRRRHLLWRVEAPLATPLAIAGLRTSTVQVIATATLAAWVGYRCLGTLIFEGFAQQDDGKILTGAVFVAALTVLTEIGFSLLERVVTPWQRQVRRRRRPTPTPGPAAAGRSVDGRTQGVT